MTPRGRSLCDSVLPLVIALRGVKSEATGDTEKHGEAQGKAGSDGLRGDQRFRNSASKVGSMLPPLITTTLIFVLGNSSA